MRRLSAVALVALAASLLYAAGTKEMHAAEPAASYAYTDSLGREVMLPKTVSRVAPSGNTAQLAVYAIAPEKLVGWSSRLTEDAMNTFLPEIAKLPVFGTFYGKKANLNREALIAAGPEVIIDIGEIKGSRESMARELDELSADIGIPVVFIEGYLENTGDVFLTLGRLLGKEAEGKRLAEYAERALSYADRNRDMIKTSVYYASSPDGLLAIEKGSFHGELIDFVGADNVVPASFSGSNGTVSAESIMLWNPDVILLTDSKAYDNALKDRAWGTLSAVKNGRVYKIPSSPYSFIDNPPATNRLIGIYWLSSVLAPELYDISIEDEVREYYSLFYHKELDEMGIAEVLGRGI